MRENPSRKCKHGNHLYGVVDEGFEDFFLSALKLGFPSAWVTSGTTKSGFCQTLLLLSSQTRNEHFHDINPNDITDFLISEAFNPRQHSIQGYGAIASSSNFHCKKI